MAFRAGAREGEELTARERGKLGPVAQADDDNQEEREREAKQLENTGKRKQDAIKRQKAPDRASRNSMKKRNKAA